MAVSFEDIYRKHFGATKADITQANAKNPTPSFIKTSGVDTRNKYLADFKGASKAYSANNSDVNEEEKKKKSVQEIVTKYKDTSVNKYDDGTLWTKAPNREYLNQITDEEKSRVEYYSTLNNYEKEYLKQNREENESLRQSLNPNQMFLSDEYIEEYWKKANSTPLDSVRSQVDYYTGKLNDANIEVPDPKKDTFKDKVQRTFISLLQIPDIIGNGIAGYVNEGVNIEEKRAENNEVDLISEYQRYDKEITSAKKAGDDELVKKLKEERDALSTQWAEYSKKGYSNIGEKLSSGIKSSIGTLKSIITAPFTDKDYNDVVTISNVFNNLRESEYSEANKKFGQALLNPVENTVIDDIAINLTGEILMSKNFEINGIYDSLKVVRNVDDVKAVKKATDFTEANIDNAKSVIRQTNREAVTKNINANFSDLPELDRGLKIEAELDKLADAKYTALIKRTGKQLDGVAVDYNGVKIGDMSIISPKAIENLSKTKYGRAIGNTVGTTLNPIGSVYNLVKSYSNTSLKEGNALGKAMVGGKTQDLVKDIFNKFDDFKADGGDTERLYRAVSNKYDVDKLRHAQQFIKDKLKKNVMDLEEQGKKAGIYDNMEDFTDRLERDGVPINKGDTPYDVKEGIVDSVGTTSKEAIPELKEAQKQIRKDLEYFNKNLSKYTEEEQKIIKVLSDISDKQDDYSKVSEPVISKLETQIKKYNTRISNGTGNTENITNKLNEYTGLVNKVKTMDLDNLPNNIKEDINKIINEPNRLSNIKTVDDYKNYSDSVVQSYYNDLESVQGKIKEYSGYVEKLNKKFTNVNDMLSYYRNSLGEEFKIDKPLLDLQEEVAIAVDGIPEKFDAFYDVDKSVKDVAEKLQKSFMEMGIEEGIIKDASDYISYVFHKLNPDLKDSKVIDKLLKEGYETPFNINSLDRKLKGSIKEINAVIKNQYGIENWFETNIFKIFAERASNHEKFMYKQQLADLLNVNSVDFDKLSKGFDNLQEAEDLAKRLGIELEEPLLRDGIGMEKRLIDPIPKDRLTGRPLYEAGENELQTQWKSYTGVRKEFVDEQILKGKTLEEAKELADKSKLKDYEWLDNSEKANVKYSPDEKMNFLNNQIRQKIYDIENGNDPDFMVLKNEVEEVEGFQRVVKDEVISKKLTSEELIENETVQERLTNEMLEELMQKGMSAEDAIIYSGRGEFLVGLNARLKEVNSSFTLQGYATNQIDLISDTYTDIKNTTIKNNLKIVDKNVYNQYKKMIDEVNGKKVSSVLKVYNKVMNTFKSWALTSNGFHINNVAGGYLNNFMQIGVDSLSPRIAHETQKILRELKGNGFDTSKIVGELYGHSRKEIADTIIENGLLSTFMSVENANLEDFINTGATSIVGNKSPLKKLLSAINPLDTQNNVLVKKSGDFGNWSEQSMKINNFMAHIKNGEELEIGADLAKEAMFDYTDMTTFNEGIKKALAPFITFVQKNAKFQVEQLSISPWKGRVMLEGVEQINNQASEKEKFLTPDYLKGAIRVGENKRFNVELPTISFLNTISNPSEIMNQLNPLLKAPIEFAMNKKMYSGSDISEMNDTIEKLRYSVETLSPWIKTYQRLGGLTTEKEYDKKSPLGKLLTGEETREKSLGWLAGNKLKTFDEKRAEQQTMYDYLELLKKTYNSKK